MTWCFLVRSGPPAYESNAGCQRLLRAERFGFWCPLLGAESDAEKIADGRVSLPARSRYISENRGTVLGKSRHGRVYPAVFPTRHGESGRRPISCVCFTL